MGRTIAIGDIHGCSVALATLVLNLKVQPDDLVISLGDVIDRGPDSRQCIETLLFLEKQLVDMHTFIKKLPVLDPSETWISDAAQDCYATEAVETIRTKKVPRNHVKAEATEKHPAQVEVYYEDLTVGFWRTVKYSGALPARRVAALLERVENSSGPSNSRAKRPTTSK